MARVFLGGIGESVEESGVDRGEAPGEGDWWRGGTRLAGGERGAGDGRAECEEGKGVGTGEGGSIDREERCTVAGGGGRTLGTVIVVPLELEEWVVVELVVEKGNVDSSKMTLRAT